MQQHSKYNFCEAKIPLLLYSKIVQKTKRHLMRLLWSALIKVFEKNHLMRLLLWSALIKIFEKNHLMRLFIFAQCENE